MSLSLVLPNRDRVNIQKMAFVKGDFIFQENFDVVSAFIYPGMLQHGEEMSLKKNSFHENSTFVKNLNNINFISLEKRKSQSRLSRHKK